jgi:hypothetical protein
MTLSLDCPFLVALGQKLAVAGLLAGMALMAFAAGLALLGAVVGLPLLVGLAEARQRLRNGPIRAGRAPEPTLSRI